MPFKALGLSDPLVQGILATGFTAPTDIQAKAIPLAIAGRDIIGCAQTGTGKTAAFVLPILNRFDLHPAHGGGVRALTVTPTRELALQVETAVRDYGRFMHLKTLAIYGGSSMEHQIRSLRQGVDFIVATPGRLLDLMRNRYVTLSHIECFVLDEADRMFDMGFINDVRSIVAALPRKRQTMLFSATISSEVKQLSAAILDHPASIQIGTMTSPVDTVTHRIYTVPKNRKMDLMIHVLGTEDMDSVLVFSRTKHGADKITTRLSRSGINAVAIHSGRTQGQRLKALEGFRNGRFRVMVATDIAARGIDVQGISHVINYDIPQFPEDYIHRVGRTGRATAKGDAWSFVSPEEMQYLRKIEQFTGKHFQLTYFLIS